MFCRNAFVVRSYGQDVPCPLRKHLQRIEHVLIIRDRYSKLARAIPKSNTTSSYVAILFLAHWIIQLGILTIIFTKNGAQFVSMFFQYFSIQLTTKHFTSTSYRSQTHRQDERFNKTIMTRLGLHVAEKQRNWDMSMQPLTYAHNIQIHRSVNTSHYSLISSRQSPGPSILTANTNVPGGNSGASSSQAMCAKLQLQITALSLWIGANEGIFQEEYKHAYGRRVRGTFVFKPDDYVIINIPSLRSTVDNNAEALSKETYNKTQLQTARPFKIITVRKIHGQWTSIQYHRQYQ